MESKKRRLERYQTLNEYKEEFGSWPWIEGDNGFRSEIHPAVAAIIRTRHGASRIAIPRDTPNYSARVLNLFAYVTLGDCYEIISSYTKRDAVLGDSVSRVTKRTEYAAPNGTPSTAYSTGMEVVEDTAPMHENADRALSIQDGWKEVYTEAAKAYDRCFLGVLA